ncbi:SDR family NAD(P)-dependent oxidoreductase [Shewanella atlantica]|uniref:SDR family NAD(P)-dependent oxidoreductase n=1 Tax=Shewanella atlantica TaxID=271099 RepID=UPI003734EE59
MKIKTVSIVGCGWFGLPLAKALVEQGYVVSGSKRKADAAAALTLDGISGFSLDLDKQQFNGVVIEEGEPGFDKPTLTELHQHLHTQAIVINIPPAMVKSPGAYLKRLGFLKRLMAGHVYQRIIFVSTTGVYPASEKPVTEDDAAMHSPSSEVLLEAENLFRELPDSCIIRFAGLVGQGRHPGRFLAGKQNLSGRAAPINLVHLDDCIGAVSCILSARPVSPVYNICANQHPGREAFYSVAAESIALKAPTFNEEEQVGKSIDGSKISADLGFQYRYDDPFDMLGEC